MIITYYCYIAVYFLVFFIPFFPIILGVDYLAKLCASIPILGFVLRAIVLLLALIFIIFISWIAHLAARAKVYDDELFVVAISSATAQVRLHLAFLPLIGKLFSSETKENEDK